MKTVQYSDLQGDSPAINKIKDKKKKRKSKENYI
jgi:hypothetical protein